MLVTLKELLEGAKKTKRIDIRIDGTTLEAVQGIIKAAEEMNSPVILQHAQSHDAIIPLEEMGPILLYYAKKAKVPAAVHLDHGNTYERCIQAIRIGFTSIMYDASAKELEENIKGTKEIVKAAHAAGVSVEAELGHVFTSKVGVSERCDFRQEEASGDPEDIYTDPETAKRFVEETGVDCLAVAFGTVHGVYLKEPKLDLDRVARIRDLTKVPLVMHGGSGVSESDYRKAIANGICKINYYTYMNTAAGKASKEYWEHDCPLFYDQMALAASQAIKEDVKKAIKIFQNQ